MTSPDILSHTLGAIAALSSAALWAVSAILFRQLGDSLSALVMNFGKGIVASICIGVVLIFLANFSIPDSESLAYLAVSGILGICLGDTLYFMALVRLGPRLTLILSSLIPVVTAILAVSILGESISLLGWSGLGLTIFGVAWVLWAKVGDDNSVILWKSGLLFGGLFVLANALAILFSKIGVNNISALDATFYRQLFALFGLGVWLGLSKNMLKQFQPLRNPKLITGLIFAAIIGAFLGTWLSILAIKLTHASVAAALNSTSPLFVLPLAVWWLKEKLTVHAIYGALTAVTGIGIYFLSLN